jgi:hypothetical protein
MLRSTLTPKSRAHAPRRVSLSGGTRKNAPSKTLDEFSNLMMKTALDTAVDLITAARNESANGRLKRDTMAGILNVLPPDCSKHMIYNRERKRRRLEEEILDTTINVPELEPVDVPELEPALNKGGRPLGATNEAKHDREEREDMAKAHVVKVLLARWAERKPGKRTERNELKLIIEAAKEKFNVHNLIIGESMIRQRANTGKTLTRRGGVSPMLEIEPLLVIFVICLQRIGTPLNPTSFLALANSLIEGTPLEKKVLESKNGGKIGAANGTRYYMGFMKRHKDEIDSKCPRKFPADRKNWTTYPNIDSMYDMVYAVLLEAKVASRADSPQWTDKSGQSVETEAEAFGSLVEFTLDHPKWFLFVDELGKNTNQKDGGNRKQARVLVEKNTEGKQTCSTTDNRFTILGFTASTGEPVMCVVVFQG